MRADELWARRASENFAVAWRDLAATHPELEADRARLLRTLLCCEGDIFLYRPEQQHYAVGFGEFGASRHVAVVVPGVGDGTNMCSDWIPGARHLYEAAESTTVVLWKGYDNPVDLLAAAAASIECSDVLATAALDLTEFVGSLPVGPEHSVTIVAHSFGTVVTGAALADCGLRCTDVVVAGSPGMTVDDLRQLHLDQSHFFAEQAPGDAIAELGIFGTAPTSPTFGGRRLRTNAPDHPEVHAHSHYFEPGSQALENIVDVVTGRYADVLSHHSTPAEMAGALVAWCLRLPVVPARAVGRHYRGPGFRVLTNATRLVEFGAAQTGNVVADALDEGGRAVAWLAHRVATAPRSALEPD
ncbi:MAG TPA: alpha/beta hydrolase [Acidimicrobiales bacterium]|jgi:pimeloyl-ACP methyl ester carboxylesterase|nr:alpha/beta hydrolase [Acidimicrobiales bacterium]